jgi:hypothetical protein
LFYSDNGWPLSNSQAWEFGIFDWRVEYVKKKSRFSQSDKKLMSQMREAADHGAFEACVRHFMVTVMSGDIPCMTGANNVEKLKLIVIRQLADMANIVAAEKGLPTFSVVHPSVIFDPASKR